MHVQGCRGDAACTCTCTGDAACTCMRRGDAASTCMCRGDAACTCMLTAFDDCLVMLCEGGCQSRIMPVLKVISGLTNRCRILGR